MKISFDFNLTDLNGKNPISAGKTLAEAMAYGNIGNPVKIMDMALKLHNGKALDVDKVDYQLIHDIINESRHLRTIAKAQLLQALEKQKK